MDLDFNNRNNFIEFKEEIKQRLRNRNKIKVNEPGTRPSAVMIILMNKDNMAHVLLTKRTNSVRTHKGQVSFPGGGREKEDRDLLETALRETYEETGIDPKDVEVIGEFDEYISITSFHVSTFVGSIKYPYEYNINRDEIEEYIEVPLSIFYNKEYEKIDYYQDRGKDLENYNYMYNGFSIWGLTARILTHFAEKILH